MGKRKDRMKGGVSQKRGRKMEPDERMDERDGPKLKQSGKIKTRGWKSNRVIEA